jgi:hypothetical protein
MAQGTIIRSNAGAKPPINKKTNANPSLEIKPEWFVAAPPNAMDTVNQTT